MDEQHQITSSEAALYDRQIRLWGVKAQNRLKNSKVLCVGLNALGAELCKNIVLAGLNVSILDTHIVTERDLGIKRFRRRVFCYSVVICVFWCCRCSVLSASFRCREQSSNGIVEPNKGFKSLCCSRSH